MAPVVQTAKQPATTSLLGRAYKELADHLFLRCVSENGGTRPVGVTSVERGAGKSTIAKNLAVASARAGIHTLLITPQAPYDAGGHCSISLYDIVDKGAEWVDAVHATPQHDLFYAVHGQQLPRHDTDTIDSLKRVLLLRFERVIVDLPIIDTIADQPISQWLVRDAIVILQPGSLQRQETIAARRTLDATGMRNLGVILNKYDDG